jgi:hypothetical protein
MLSDVLTTTPLPSSGNAAAKLSTPICIVSTRFTQLTGVFAVGVVNSRRRRVHAHEQPRARPAIAHAFHGVQRHV